MKTHDAEVKMTEHNHAIVWIDHKEAKIFYFSGRDFDQIDIRSEHPNVKVHRKANSIGNGHAAPDTVFFQHIIDALAEPKAILITGPASAKSELVKYIDGHAENLRLRIAGVETVDHPSDGELVAFARSYFKSADRITPQIA